MLEFIPSKQVPQRLTEGWQIVSRNRGDYAALMHAPEGWEPVVSTRDDGMSTMYRCDGRTVRLGEKPPRLKRVCREKLDRRCTMPECEKPHHGNGLCKMHHSRLRRLGDVNMVRPPGRTRGTCEVPSCKRQSTAQGLCNRHYLRLRKNGSVT